MAKQQKGILKTTTIREGVLTLDEVKSILADHFGIDTTSDTVYIEFITDDDGDGDDIDNIVGVKISSQTNNPL